MIQGTGIALATPFKEDLSVDFEALRKLVESVISGGVEFLVALGTTGETPTLSSEEKLAVVNCILEQNNGRLPVICGIGGNNTRQVINTIKQYPQEKLTGILSVVPYYNKPNQQAIYQHFKAISESTDTNIILYNVPGRTADNMEAEITIKLAKDCQNIVAVKEASGNMQQCMALVQNAPDDFAVLSGDDDLILSQAALGFKGVISVAGNCFPATFSEMVRLARHNDVAKARPLFYQMIEAIHLLFAEGNPTGVKAMLHLQGKITNKLRLPLISASRELQQKLAAFKDIR